MKHKHLLPGMAATLMTFALSASIAGCKQKSPDAPPATSAAEAAPTAVATPAAEAAIPDASAPVSFEAELEFIDLVFKIKTHGDGAKRLLMVTANRSGVVVGEPGSAVLDGAIASAFAADLNGDQQAEIAVVTKAVDGKTAFAVLAFNGSSYKEFRLPELDATLRAEAAAPDEFAFENGQIVRRYAAKAGGTKTVNYSFDPAAGFAAAAP